MTDPARVQPHNLPLESPPNFNHDWRITTLIMAVVTLLTTAFTLLRNARSAIAVADMGGSASLVPFYELAALPASIILSWSLACLLRKHSLPRIFYLSLIAFNLFFLLFLTFYYPFWKSHAIAWQNAESLLHQALFYFSVGSFFILSELWKVALISILLWGYLNTHMTMNYAKTCYAPLMLGASLGSFLAGPLVSLSSNLGPVFLQPLITDDWHATLVFETLILVISSICAGTLFFVLTRRIPQKTGSDTRNPQLNLFSSLQNTLKHPLLGSLTFIVLTDYVTYTLFEILFLNTLKINYPDPLAFNGMMGTLNQWGGALTAFAAIIIGPWILHRYSWKTTALITPLSVILLATPYMALVVGGMDAHELTLFFGCACYCICRGTKYALLDSSKELAYLCIPSTLRLQGKLIIEGIASRSGRALASTTTLGLIALSGGISLVPFPIFITFISTSYLWIKMTIKSGDAFNTISASESDLGA